MRGVEGSCADVEDESVESSLPENHQDSADANGDALVMGQDATVGEDIAGSQGVDTVEEINVKSFELWKVGGKEIQGIQDAWRLFHTIASSQEAVGEAIYNAVFESSPSLQALFVSPRAVQAMRFHQGLASFVSSIDSPEQLKASVESLGFGHIYLDVTVPRVVIFRDAIIDLFAEELGERFTPSMRKGWTSLLNYIGGAIIYVKANYCQRTSLLLESWKAANDKVHNLTRFGASSDSSEQMGYNSPGVQLQGGGAKTKKKACKSLTNMFGGGLQNNAKANDEVATDSNIAEHRSEFDNGSNQNVPTTYPEMFKFNAIVMGFGEKQWLMEVLAVFDNLVTNVLNSVRLQEEGDVLMLRVSKVTTENVNLGEYKSCMLASLRSLLPKDWSTEHEVAWSWFWANVESMLLKNMGNPSVWEKALGKAFCSLHDRQKFEIRKAIYARFFDLAPSGQNFFKQSSAYLHIIAEKIMNMTIDMYINPVKMVDDISALGLRHVGYDIPVPLIAPFVTACVEIFSQWCKDKKAIEAFRWSLGLVSRMLSRTITEGSTVVMKAINTNAVKNLRKAVSCAPRGERAKWMLRVQVGTQNISPLLWAIESGAFEAASFIFKDLLSIRADRDKYYYGVDELFDRHPNIVQTLCVDAPGLLPVLLDGLIWRARVTQNGQRRVNYYVKHLLVNPDGTFASALRWISHLKDPKIVCHPVVALLSDKMWKGVSRWTFTLAKSWSVMTLVVFITSQSVLKRVNDGDNGATRRYVVFACRAVVYGLSLTQLIFYHARESFKAYRSKNLYRLRRLHVSLPQYWIDVTNAIKLLLMALLLAMLACEPILTCWDHSSSDMLFFEFCEEAADLAFAYSFFSMLAMFLYYSLLLDIAVLSSMVSAFLVMCRRMVVEVALFVMAVAGFILAFSSAISALHQDEKDFRAIPPGMLTLIRMELGFYSQERYEEFRMEPVVLVVIFVFLVAATIFFPSLLVAQIACVYSSVYDDILGYARLHRINVVIDSMLSVSSKRWDHFVASLRLDQKLEFNAGDPGPPGGIQELEPASVNPTTTDMIMRFGGSTSPTMPWPEAGEGEAEGDDHISRMEHFIKKKLKHNAGRNKGDAAATGSGGSAGSAELLGSEGESEVASNH